MLSSTGHPCIPPEIGVQRRLADNVNHFGGISVALAKYVDRIDIFINLSKLSRCAYCRCAIVRAMKYLMLDSLGIDNK